jgi:acetyl-CoA synthetase
MPVLRGTQAAFAAIARLAWWEDRRAGRLADGPARAAWPALAVDVPRYGRDPAWHPPGGVEMPSPATTALSERESLELLRGSGVPVVEAVVAETADAAAAVAARLGWPVVVKLDAIGVAHKSDLGGVVVDLADEAAVRVAFEAVTAAGRAAHLSVRGALVEPQAEAGVELIIGARRDAHVGPLVVIGLGGILAEVLDDVAIRLAPVSHADARQMIDELRGAAILRGTRGRRPVDLDALAELVVALGRAVVEHPQWLEVDLNPVIAGASGALAVDALVVVADAIGGVSGPEDPSRSS